MTPIKAILFDADGVIINPSMQYSKYLDRTYGITLEITRPFFMGEFNECLTGKKELRLALPPHLEQWGWKGSADEFVDQWLEMEDRVDARLMDTIQGLRAAGYLCGLATLQERNRAEYMKTKMRFTELFDGLFFSCEIGWQKPHPKYFQAIEDRLKYKVTEILFWDDRLENVEGARNFGWQAEFYSGFDAFEKILKNYLD